MSEKYQFKLTVELSPTSWQGWETAIGVIKMVLDSVTYDKNDRGLHDIWDYELEPIK